MSQFVSECRKEWHRLGVPEAVSNEMATDLEADLAEAQADGVSPEAVLGNGFFDAKSFAASWATARGIVGSSPRDPVSRRLPSRALAAGVVVGVAAALLGLAILIGHPMGSTSVAAAAVRHQILIRPPVPGLFGGPHRVFVEHAGFALAALGGALFLAGLLGLGVTLWLWRPRSTRGHGSGFDQDVGMPSYL